ncbi:MAG: hypothetical protein O6853_01040 [Actinobacteria bacterium]|nr:hypothetical protein [Actinomycetota bacterium]
MDGFAIFLVIVVLGFVGWYLTRSRRKQARLREESPTTAGAGTSIGRDLYEPDASHHAPVADFHVQGEEAIVVFDVPLSEEDDPVLNELLVDEAIEVVREKRHTLPIDGVTVVVVRAGRGESREIGRRELPAVGELPPPVESMGLSLANIAHDPFAAPFEEETDHSVVYETKTDVPSDELGPIMDELKLPTGLERGLRAIGIDPGQVSAPDLVLALLRMFGYGITDQAVPGTYMVIKDGLSTYILTEPHRKGEHPELDESTCKRFIAGFGSSGADRGLLLTGKYGPFMIYDMEARQPNIRFITRERLQGFIDWMALG